MGRLGYLHVRVGRPGFRLGLEIWAGLQFISIYIYLLRILADERIVGQHLRKILEN